MIGDIDFTTIALDSDMELDPLTPMITNTDPLSGTPPNEPLTQSPDAPDTNTSRYSCQNCDASFPTKNELDYHRRSHQTVATVTFTSGRSLDVQQQENGKWKCPVCDKCVQDLRALRYHASKNCSSNPTNTPATEAITTAAETPDLPGQEDQELIANNDGISDLSFHL